MALEHVAPLATAKPAVSSRTTNVSPSIPGNAKQQIFYAAFAAA
jgi:hypothetical protein